MDDCEECGEKTFKRCSRCKKSYYCSQMCQQKNWDLHKTVCVNKVWIQWHYTPTPDYIRPVNEE